MTTLSESGRSTALDGFIAKRLAIIFSKSFLPWQTSLLRLYNTLWTFTFEILLYETYRRLCFLNSNNEAVSWILIAFWLLLLIFVLFFLLRIRVSSVLPLNKSSVHYTSPVHWRFRSLISLKTSGLSNITSNSLCLYTVCFRFTILFLLLLSSQTY